jgi:hypothetical protein
MATEIGEESLRTDVGPSLELTVRSGDRDDDSFVPSAASFTRRKHFKFVAVGQNLLVATIWQHEQISQHDSVLVADDHQRADSLKPEQSRGIASFVAVPQQVVIALPRTKRSEHEQRQLVVHAVLPLAASSSSNTHLGGSRSPFWRLM